MADMEEVFFAKECLAECKDAGLYEEALLQAESFLQQRIYDADLMFEAADLYFMAGDYSKALLWCDSILELDPQHKGARILMARICVLGDCPKDGLRFLDEVLVEDQTLNHQAAERIRYLLEYLSYRKDFSCLLKEHPLAKAFWENTAG